MVTAIIPKLPFIDKGETLRFYVDQLGFSLVSDYGDYLLLRMDNAEVHLFSYPDIEPATSDFMAYIRMDSGIQDFYKAIQKRETRIHANGSLHTKPWKQLEFAVSDPNGTLLTFGQPV